MVKTFDSQHIHELQLQLTSKMSAQKLLSPNLRLTLVGLPISLDPQTGKVATDPKKIAKDLVNRAQRHRAKREMQGVELQYCLGLNPNTGRFALPHITKVQMKAADGNSAQQTFSSFMTFVNNIAPFLPEMINTSINAKGTFDVKAGNKSYKPIKNHKTVWADDNIDKSPLAEILKIMGNSLSRLGLLPLVVNGLGVDGENSRPHFTNEREEDESAARALLSEPIDAEITNEKFALIPAIAISDESGELFLDNILQVCINGNWVKPESAKSVLLTPEEVPMPSYYSIAFEVAKPMLRSFGLFAAGCTAALVTQTLVNTLNSKFQPSSVPRLDL